MVCHVLQSLIYYVVIWKSIVLVEVGIVVDGGQAGLSECSLAR